MKRAGTAFAGVLASFFAVAALSPGRVALAADFGVGRVRLRLTDEGWTSVGASGEELPASGNVAGAVGVVKRSFLLVDGDGRFRAALVVSATRGVPVGQQWPDDCRSQDNLYAIDARQASGEGGDCLRVSGLTSLGASLATDAPAVATALAMRKTVVPAAGYVVLDWVALRNGTFVAVEALIAADVQLPANSIGQRDLPTGVNAQVLAWGERLHEAAKGSVHSVSGLLVVPAVIATPN